MSERTQAVVQSRFGDVTAELGIEVESLSVEDVVTIGAIATLAVLAESDALVGVTGAADILDVSRQYVSKIAKQHQLPNAVANLGANGPVWFRWDIEAFAEDRAQP